MRSGPPKTSSQPKQKLSALDCVVAILGGMSGRLIALERRVAEIEAERDARQNRASR